MHIRIKVLLNFMCIKGCNIHFLLGARKKEKHVLREVTFVCWDVYQASLPRNGGGMGW